MAHDLLGHFGRTADEQRPVRTSLHVKRPACDWPPSALLADLGECASISREKTVGRLLRRVCDIAERVHADVERGVGVSGTAAGFSVKIDQRTKASRFSAYNRYHQRKSK